ncbi:hypothetical protein A1Q2_06636 [Trichosporon asahii var. asahii CBS 8904]|uniref:AB hydrolase-1 domain-containing protein n=1 Tax=Trichosporon asahii var. asahii (strain CBS 8904) TaxID=1220162 RepID=K1VE14_TRIAC|nr:hypothetical protein A1Q2_06636 [Trichosporon asahii var. asahii CBS 8904]
MDALGRVGKEDDAIPVSEYRTVGLPSNVDIAYIEAGKIEAGNTNKHTLVLLHDFPSSSAQFKTLIPRLATRYHVLAPDLPNFGFTSVPMSYKPSFESMAKAIAEFLKVMGVDKAAFYGVGYGADVVFRIALQTPDVIKALVVQNGNAYEKGLGDAWKPFERWWQGEGAARDELYQTLGDPSWTKHRWYVGVPDSDVHKIDPMQYTEAYRGTLRDDNKRDTQFTLLWDYQENVKLYPKIQEWLKKNTPLLVLWGRGDDVYSTAAPEGFKKDSQYAKVVMMDGGHFLTETKVPIIAKEVRDFLEGVDW